MAKFVLSLILIINLSSQLLAQRKNLVSYTNYQYHEFDENPLIRNTITDAFANFGRWEKGDFEKDWYRLYMPTSISFFTHRVLNKSSFIKVNALIRYRYNRSSNLVVKKIGQSQAINQSALSITYNYIIWRLFKEKVWVNAYAGLHGRIGRNETFMGELAPLARPFSQKLRDVGVNGGSSVIIFVPFNLVLSAELGINRWLYVQYNSKYQQGNFALPRNSFDMRVSIGYTFGKKVKTLQEEAEEALEKKSD